MMHSDILLQDFLQVRDETLATCLLQRLLREHAEPIVTAIIEDRFHVSLRRAGGRVQSQVEQDAEDMRGKVLLDLTARLRDLQRAPGQNAIRDFRAYVAVTTYRAFGRHLAARYQSRTALKERLQYLLSHQEGYALWTYDTSRCLCGYARWRNRKQPAVGRRLQQLRDDPHAFARAALPQAEASQIRLPDLLQRLFDWVGCPIEINDLVAIVAALLGVEDSAACAAVAASAQDQMESQVASDPPVFTQIEQREYVRRLWAEIRQLPPAECTALLLDMARADGLAVIMQFPLNGVANLADIAAAVEMPPETFTEIWNELPLRDDAIATLLQTIPQKVINLRKSARERLAKRMRALEEPA